MTRFRPKLDALDELAEAPHEPTAASHRGIRSVSLAWLALVGLDLASRAAYLAPRLATLRGAANYLASCAALFVVVRLLTALPHRARLVVHVLFVALPMAIQWAAFRSYGQFVAPTDIAVFFESPRVVLLAVREGGDHAGSLLVLLLATAAAWLLPPTARPLSRGRLAAATLLLAGAFATGTSYWQASPSLEHGQPAFACALIGSMQRATSNVRGTGRPALASQADAPVHGHLPNIVVVLGESLAASHLSIYGYERPTTPRLQRLRESGELVAFEDAVVVGPHTRTSVPYIVTGLSGPDPAGRVFRAPTVMQYAKARGYHTAFVSAQEESWGELDALLREGADVFRTGIAFAPKVDVLKGADDLVVLERGALPAIRSLAAPFFLVVHMDGSHLPYASHSPASHKVFPEDDPHGIGAYDNTIRVTDEVVARLHEALRERDPGAFMFFTSDHGQPLGQGGAFYNRGYQPNVVRDPLLAFVPASEDRAPWASLARSQVSACDLAPTLLHLMQTSPLESAPMDCIDWLAGPVGPRFRVVSAYTPAYVAEPTMLVLEPGGARALYDLSRRTVTMDDGIARPMAEHPYPAEIAARLEAGAR